MVIAAKVDMRSVMRTLRTLQKEGQDLRPIFRAMRKPVMDDQREHRKKQEGPSGKWPARAPSTLLRYKKLRARGRKPPKRLLGRLPTANQVTIDKRRLRVVSKVRWSKRPRWRGRDRVWLWLSPGLPAKLRDALLVALLQRAFRRLAGKR